MNLTEIGVHKISFRAFFSLSIIKKDESYTKEYGVTRDEGKGTRSY
jgi:hypothetical protein